MTKLTHFSVSTECVRALLLAYMLLLAVRPLAARERAARYLTLHEAIILARKQSVDATSALGQLKSAYWSYRSFRADLLPEINLSATLPGKFSFPYERTRH